MSTNYIAKGDVIDVTLAGTKASGAFHIAGPYWGVLQSGGGNGDVVPMKRTGIHDLPKVGSQAWAIGDLLYWDAGNSRFTKTWAAGLIAAGIAASVVGSGAGETLGYVNLLPDGIKTIAFQWTTVTATDEVATGLQKVLAVTATFQTDPADANTYVSATIGDQAGSPDAGEVIIKTWKQSGTDPTPIAADAFSKVVNVVAVGY